MKKSLITIICLIAGSLLASYLLGSCRKKNSTRGLTLLQQEVPAGFPVPLYHFEDIPLTQEGVALGRKLFYDKRLSADNLTPCSSCHQQTAAFGTYEHDLSHGVFGSHTQRNAPPLFNLVWSPSYHWDGQFTSLVDEAVHPITGPVEMGETFDGIIAKIGDDADYKQMFKNVFQSSSIRPEYILKALAQFTGTLISADSKYDRYKKGQASLNVGEQNGYQLYLTKCASCHPEPMFTDYKMRNIGLPFDGFLNDKGRMAITGKSEDSLKFKTPSLRNSNITSNYMHDGRFNTLQQVMNHYRSGVQQGPTLDPLLNSGIPLTDLQIEDLFSFLKTLTDSAFIKNPQYSKPQ